MNASDQERVKGLIGLSARSGQTATGEETCVSRIRAGRAALALIDEGLSLNGEKRYLDACRKYNVKLARMPQGMIGRALGRDGRMAVTIEKGGLADRLMELTEAVVPQ